ncbi:MAG: flavin reductase family protein [Ruminococcus sp.]|nr:flavin reductase family protein [Ruminococcus sp.]
MDTRAFTKLSYGVYVVTSWADGGIATGCIANSAMQVTSSPATIAVSINHENFTNECIKSAGRFALNILGENSNPAIIGSFGFRSGRDVKKFEGKTPVVKDCLPILDNAIAYVTCKVTDTMETSTHTVFLGEVIDAQVLNDDTPMTYAYYHNVIKGKSPKTAPTYVGE